MYILSSSIQHLLQYRAGKKQKRTTLQLLLNGHRRSVQPIIAQGPGKPRSGSTDATTAITTLTTALTTVDRVTKFYKGWATKLPNGPKRDEAIRGLAKADTAMQLAQAKLAEAFGYNLCWKHAPPGVLLHSPEDASPQWKCHTCGQTEGIPPRDWSDNPLIDVRR